MIVEVKTKQRIYMQVTIFVKEFSKMPRYKKTVVLSFTLGRKFH